MKILEGFSQAPFRREGAGSAYLQLVIQLALESAALGQTPPPGHLRRPDGEWSTGTVRSPSPGRVEHVASGILLTMQAEREGLLPLKYFNRNTT